jgi:hypothetical protein
MDNLADTFLAKIDQLSSRAGILNAVVTRVATRFLPNSVANAACSCTVYDECVGWDSGCYYGTTGYRPYRVKHVCCTHFPCDPTCYNSSYWQTTYVCRETCS